MNKKPIILLAAVLALAVGGCGFSEKKEDKITEIRFSFWEPGVSHEIEDAMQQVIDGYEELNPDVKIKLISEPVDTYQDWINSSIISDNMPDIQSNHSDKLTAQYNAGLIVDISDSLNSKSPYSDAEVWSDTIKNKRAYATQGNIFVPFFGVELGIYYNKTLYDSLGLKVPETWQGFIENCEVIKNSGKQPIAFMSQKSDACDWLKWDIAGGLFAKKHLMNLNININNDTAISTYEASRAMINGTVDFDKDPEYRKEYTEYVKRMSEFLSYCSEYPGLEETVAKAMFLSGEAAHIYSGSWDVNGLMKNDNIGFETGVFPFPLFTDTETDYGGKRIKHLSTQVLAVTKSACSEEGKLEKVIDFLQYFTSKDVYGEFIKNTALLPVVEGVDYVEGTEIFEYDGYNTDTMFLLDGDNEIIYSLLSGNTIEMDDAFFEDLQERMLNAAYKYADMNKLSAENGYYMEESPMEVFSYED